MTSKRPTSMPNTRSQSNNSSRISNPTSGTSRIPRWNQDPPTESPQRAMFAGMKEANFTGNVTMQNFTFVQDGSRSLPKAFKQTMNAYIQPSNVPIDDETLNLADHEIYHQHLLLKKRGIPLWIPGPNVILPVEYRRIGINFGDVGILWPSGEFDFLFNVFLPADHPINKAGVPESFFPLDPKTVEHDIEHHYPYGPYDYLASMSLKKISHSSDPLVFQSHPESTNGAVLVMPEGASSWNLRNTRMLDRYAALNLTRWYKYAIEDRGRSTVMNGDIRVVTGFDKVSRWGIATFNSPKTVDMPVDLAFCLDANAGTYFWDCRGSGSGRAGPLEREVQDFGTEVQLPQNQSVFVRTINPTLPSAAWKVISALLVPSDKSGRNDSPPASRQPMRNSGLSQSRLPPPGKSRPPIGQPYRRFLELESSVMHPSTLINQRLLEEFPDAEIVITHDSDWISVLKEEDVTFPDEEALRTRILATHRIRYEDGIVTIEAKDGAADRHSSLRNPTPLQERCSLPRALPPRHSGLVNVRGIDPLTDEEEEDDSDSDDDSD